MPRVAQLFSSTQPWESRLPQSYGRRWTHRSMSHERKNQDQVDLVDQYYSVYIYRSAKRPLTDSPKNPRQARGNLLPFELQKRRPGRLEDHEALRFAQGRPGELQRVLRRLAPWAGELGSRRF